MLQLMNNKYTKVNGELINIIFTTSPSLRSSKEENRKYFVVSQSLSLVRTKLMRIVFSNREWPFSRLLNGSRIPTNTLIARYMISEIGDARCIVADL